MEQVEQALGPLWGYTAATTAAAITIAATSPFTGRLILGAERWAVVQAGGANTLKKEYREHKWEGRSPGTIRFGANLTAFLMQVAAVSVSVPAFLRFAAEQRWTIGDAAPSRELQVALGVTMGYIVEDTLHLVVNYHKSVAMMGRSFWQQMMVHHGCVLVFLPWCYANRVAVLLAGYLIATELSNLPLNLRSLCRDLGGGRTLPQPLLTAIDLAVLVSFFVVRIVPMPWYCGAIHEYVLGDAPPHHRFVVLLGLFPVVLFLFWFGLMLKGLVALVRGTKSD